MFFLPVRRFDPGYVQPLESRRLLSFTPIGDDAYFDRFNADGTSDETFGDNGKVLPQHGLVDPAAMAYDAADNVLVAGQHSEPYFLTVVRFVPQSPDVVLDDTGTIHVATTEGPDTVALRRDGDQIVVSLNGDDTAFAAEDVARLFVPASGGDDVFTVPFALACTIEGGAGNDTVTVGDGQMSLVGGDGDDVIQAGRGAHRIELGDGNDLVTTGAGNDTIDAGDGDDTIATGPGGDRVSAGDGHDSVTTSVGFDTIYTADGNDTIHAGAGHDLVIGSPAPNGSHDQYSGSKSIFGEDGDDSLMGGAGASTVFGGAGRDTLAGGPQSDSLDGGEGDDEIGIATFAPDVGVDTIISAGPGDDPPPPVIPADGGTIVTSGQQGSFDVAVAGDGSYLVAANVAGGAVHRVTAFRYSAAGALIGGPISLYAYVPQMTPFLRTARISASMDADGDAVVAYAVFDGEDSGLYVTRISRTGVVSRSVRVAGVSDEIENSFSVSMDANGGFFVAWEELEEPRSLMKARAFDAAGAPRAEPFVVAPFAGLGYWGSIQIAALPDGSGAVFAIEFSAVAGFRTEEILRLGWTSSSEVVDVGFVSESYDILSPSLAVQTDGSFGLTHLYFDRTNPAVRGAQLRRFTAGGDQIGAPFALGASLADGGNGIRGASVDDAPDGGYVVSFVEPGDDADTLYAARFDAAGAFDATTGYIPFATDVAAAERRFGDGRFIPRLGTDPRGAVIAAYAMRSSDELRYRRLLIGENVADLRGSELFVDGTDGADHIIVERVGDDVFVNLNGKVQRLDAAGVQFLSINGFGGDDDIDNATALPSTIHGGDGSDTIWGGTGEDRILGFGGNDFLRGGDGNDTVFGGNGSDSLNGGDGNDDLSGDAGEDTLYGAVGNDVLRGHRGSDRLFGEAGNDTLEGGDADDYLEAGAGHDELTGDGGADALFGLGGNDRFFAAGDGMTDTVRGGLGTDSADTDDLDDVLGVEAVS